MPVLSVTANLNNKDLGAASKDVQKAINDLGALPRGLTVEMIGISQTLTDTMDSLETGLVIAVIVIFLMLAANFQSFKVSAVVLATVPAVILGSLALLMMCGSTLNSAILHGDDHVRWGIHIQRGTLITNAEQLRMVQW
jgi:multidrug efflux pump subunit AcrB